MYCFIQHSKIPSLKSEKPRIDDDADDKRQLIMAQQRVNFEQFDGEKKKTKTKNEINVEAYKLTM